MSSYKLKGTHIYIPQKIFSYIQYEISYYFLMSLFFECADITKVEIHYIRKALFWFESSFFFLEL